MDGAENVGTGSIGEIYFEILRSRLAGWDDDWTNDQKAAAFKAWLAAQAAAGTPVAVLYKLAAPVPITGTPQSVPTYYPYTRIVNDAGAEMTATIDPLENVKLLELLPPNYQHSTEIADTQNAINNEIEKACAAKDDFMLQLNVDTATWGLDLWEKAYGIITDLSKSYDFRRSRIKSKRRSQGVTTVTMIKNVAESFSNGEVEIIEYNLEYRFEVKFVGTLGIPPNMDDLTAAIEEIKPAHLAYAYIYIFVTHEQLKRFTHDQLAAFTHLQIRNGEGLELGN